VHTAEHDVGGVRAGGRLAGELEGVPGDVGELDDLVALVVVAEDEHLLAEGGLRGAGPFDEAGVARCRQGADALHAALRLEIHPLSEEQEGRGRAGLGERDAGHIGQPRIIPQGDRRLR